MKSELILLQKLNTELERQILRITKRLLEYDKLEEQNLLSTHGRESRKYFQGKLCGYEAVSDKLQKILDENKG